MAGKGGRCRPRQLGGPAGAGRGRGPTCGCRGRTGRSGPGCCSSPAGGGCCSPRRRIRRGLRAFDLWIAVGCALGAVLMRGAGCTWNDLTDRDIDARVARTRSRPLPSGQVTPRQAAAWMVAQALAGLRDPAELSAARRWRSASARWRSSPIYPFAKRFTWWPQVFLGLAFNWGALLGWAAHARGLGWAALLLYAAGIAWTLFYDTIYAHQDREDDALIGVKSTARLFGARTKRWLAGFLARSRRRWRSRRSLAAGLGGGALALALLGVAGFALHLALAAPPARHRRPGGLPHALPRQPRRRADPGRGAARGRDTVSGARLDPRAASA